MKYLIEHQVVIQITLHHVAFGRLGRYINRDCEAHLLPVLRQCVSSSLYSCLRSSYNPVLLYLDHALVEGLVRRLGTKMELTPSPTLP
jgi:hypothetical protein